MRRLLGLLLALAVVVSACNGAEDVGGTPADAMRIADAFLRAAQAKDTETAWSLVYPGNAAARFDSDIDEFARVLYAVDLEDLRWTVTSAVPDGDGRYRVAVDVDPGAIGSEWSFAQVVDTGAGRRFVIMVVDIEPFGLSSGVLGL